MTAFAITSANGCLACDDPLCLCFNIPSPTPELDVEGRRVFLEAGRYSFIVVVEGRPGGSFFPVGVDGTQGLPPDPSDGRPDLQIETTRSFGLVPAVLPPSFVAGQSITDALVAFARLFIPFPAVRDATCTKDGGGNTNPLNTSSTQQFCHVVNSLESFPFGDTVLTVQLRDTAAPAANFGPTAQIVVRVVTPTPQPTYTRTFSPTPTATGTATPGG